jgi:GT2 family glycosyltransferase
MGDLKISIIIPSAYRPQNLARLLNAIYASELVTPVEVIVGVMDDDAESAEVIKGYPVDTVVLRDVTEYPGGAVTGWNKLAQFARYDWLCLLADDTLPRWDWLIAVKAAHEQLGKPGLIGLNDLHTDGAKYATHFLIHRHFAIEHCGGVVIAPEYRSWWFDVELCEIAQQHGAYIFAQRAIVEHIHYDWVDSVFDKTYADSLPWHEVDRVIYEQRKAARYA